jgi:arginine decarboxylase
MGGFFVPRRYFVTSGVALDGASELNAFDLALNDANVTHCNLVEVSSILPTDSQEVEPIEIPAGAITFCVMARKVGGPGETIGCGLIWGWGTRADGARFGIVAEHHGNCGSEEVKRRLQTKLTRMAEVREVTLESVKSKVESTEVPEGNFGCVVTILIYAD